MRSLLSLTLSAALALPLAAQDKSKAIAASDAEALKAAVGKSVTITGTLESLVNEDKKQPVLLKFTDSELKVWVPAERYWKIGGWGLESFVGKPLFVHGKVEKRSSTDGLKLELLSEAHFHGTLESLVAGLPKPAPKPAAKPEEPVKYDPVSPGAIFPVNPGPKVLVPSLDTASVYAIVPKFGGPQAEMIVTEVTAEIMEEEKAGPMQATFELKPKLSIKPMIAAMTYLPKKYKSQGWPMNKTAHFILEEVQADSAPTNFAAAVLIESLLSGVEIPANVVLFGGMAANGTIIRSADKERSDLSYIEAIKLAANAARPVVEEEEEEEGRRSSRRREPAVPKPEKTMYVITGDIPDGTLDDLIIDEDWETLSSTIVLRCKTLDDAMAVLREMSTGGDVGKTITDLAAAQGVLREKSIRMLANDAVWSRVVAAGKASKDNATAFAFARMKSRQVSSHYSIDRCLGHIAEKLKIVQGPGLDKFKERDLRKHIRDIATDMKSIERKIHPAAEPVLATGLTLLSATQGRTEALLKVQSKIKDQKEKRAAKPPEREEAKYQAAKKAYQDARAAALAAAKS